MPDRFSTLDTALSDPHPSYKSPTIIQVTCEIAFTPTSENRLSGGKLFAIFADEFPEIQPMGNLNVQVVIGQAQRPEDPRLSQNATGFRFGTPDGKRFVQVSKSNFVYQSSERYPGWPSFKEKLLNLWLQAVPELVPEAIVKIGMRYINRIHLSEKYPNLSDWLEVTADLPKAFIESKEHFLCRVESSPEPSHLRLITVAREAPGPDWPVGAIIMDIDRIALDQLDSVDSAKILEKLDLLHEDIWIAFDSATSAHLKGHLAGEGL